MSPEHMRKLLQAMQLEEESLFPRNVIILELLDIAQIVPPKWLWQLTLSVADLFVYFASPHFY